MADETSTGARADTAAPAVPAPGIGLPPPRLLRWEIVTVFAVSLGASGIYALVQYIGSLTAHQSLSKQAVIVHGTLAPGRPLLDLFLQLTSISLALAPVLLVFYLLARSGERPSSIGLDASLLSAAQNAISEEVIMIGYLLSRLDRLGMRPSRAIVLSAVIRGSYHLYQGIGAFFGNAAMGVLFGIFYRRYGRVTPLIVAHTLIDAVTFVGYALLVGHGIRVEEITPERRGLEQIVLEVTTAGSDRVEAA